eukprot:c16222_g1_i1 orf=129-2693(+)
METLLYRQLQRAWLETEMRRQNGDLSSPSLISSGDGLHQTSSSSRSSSSSSWDPDAETSPDSAPPMQPPTELQDLGEEYFRDPALQYISEMLMEEELEGSKCMMAECMNYITTMRGFYDVLGAGEVPSSECLNEYEQLRASGQVEDSFKDIFSKEELSAQGDDAFRGGVPDDDSLLNYPAHEDDGNLGIFAVEDGHFGVSALNDDQIGDDVSAHIQEPLLLSTKEGVPALEGADALNASGEENQRIDDLFDNIDAIGFQQDGPAGVVYSPAAPNFSYPGLSDSSGSSHVSFQPSFDSSFKFDNRELDPLFKFTSPSPSSVSTDSSSLDFHWSNNNAHHPSNGNGQHSSTLETDPHQPHDINKTFRRSASDPMQRLPSSKTSLGIGNSRFKRAASLVDAEVVSHSIGSFSSASSGVTVNSMGEESFSFVQNKDLNAEKYASILNDGLKSMKNVLCESSSLASVRKNGGKATRNLTIVADLKGLLISCAQAVSSNNMRRAHEILQEIRQDATPFGSGLQRLAHFFAEGLVARISGTGDRLYSVFKNNSPSAAKMLKAHHLFVEVSPFVKVSHYFANRAIIKAAKGASRLHIIDYGILYGIQWPCLISALAQRKGGPPLLRITGIELPQRGAFGAERVEMTGTRLSEYAKTYGVPFEYCAIANRWETIQPSSLNIRQDEFVVVNSMHRLQHLLDETVVASNPRQAVLSKIHEINPKIFVLGIKNGNYNAPFFLSRFKEALASFSGYFDLLETLISSDNQERMMIERELLGRSILNVVACEGTERVERPETYRQWQNRTLKAGFEQIPLDRNVLKESQTIVKCSYDKNFSVDEDGSWMLLGWKGKVVHGLTLWKPAAF